MPYWIMRLKRSLLASSAAMLIQLKPQSRSSDTPSSNRIVCFAAPLTALCVHAHLIHCQITAELPILSPYGWLSKYGPLLGTLNNRCRTILGTQKGTMILTTTHMPNTARSLPNSRLPFGFTCTHTGLVEMAER